MDAHPLLGLAGRGDDALDGAQHHGVLLVEARLPAQRQGEVGWADIDSGKLGDIQDRFEVVEGVSRLDHADGQDRVVGPPFIIVSRVHAGAGGTEAAESARRIAARPREAFGLGARVDHRADDAVGARVQHLHDDPLIQPGDADQRNGRHRGDADQHLNGTLVVDQAVLQVDRQRIPAAMGHSLRNAGFGDREPAVEGGLPRPPGGEQQVLPKPSAAGSCWTCHSSSSARWDVPA